VIQITEIPFPNVISCKNHLLEITTIMYVSSKAMCNMYKYVIFEESHFDLIFF
jgi:hypothetical protein